MQNIKHCTVCVIFFCLDHYLFHEHNIYTSVNKSCFPELLHKIYFSYHGNTMTSWHFQATSIQDFIGNTIPLFVLLVFFVWFFFQVFHVLFHVLFSLLQCVQYGEFVELK